MPVRMIIDFPEELVNDVRSVLVSDKMEYVKGFILEATRTKVRICKSANERADRKKLNK